MLQGLIPNKSSVVDGVTHPSSATKLSLHRLSQSPLWVSLHFFFQSENKTRLFPRLFLIPSFNLYLFMFVMETFGRYRI